MGLDSADGAAPSGRKQKRRDSRWRAGGRVVLVEDEPVLSPQRDETISPTTIKSEAV
jgi:hypothetical protein